MIIKSHMSAGAVFSTTRRKFIIGTGVIAGALAAPPVIRARAQSAATVRWWYFLDNPNVTPDALVARFHEEHPDIRIEAERIPNNGGADYQSRLYSALLAGQGPDAAMMKIANLSRLLEMDALAPLDDYLASWNAKSDISDEHWKLSIAPDGKNYVLPTQYVVLYLYVRQDWLDELGMKAPTNAEEFLKVATAMNGKDRWGFGIRGGPGGHDAWATFVVGGGAEFRKGGFVTPEALAANDWYLDLFRKHKVSPPSTPGDGFQQTMSNLKAGRTGMTIHHLGSANDIVGTLGDRITAVPVPKGLHSNWATYGDGGQSVFSACKNPEAAFKWISWLSSGEANAGFNRLSGQLPVADSMTRNWDGAPQRFVDATLASLPMARILPNVPQTADFARTVWPQTTQKAFLGEISSTKMMETFESLYFS